ncbi:MAG: U32 family peptidase [Verrucomicrobia bacterium]|nr:U32 family peptidase [Verrucomicrobiota bacterium]
MNRGPELLSPAGNWECLRAAVANGANAIYFGLERFNARMRADNFRTEELAEVMAYLRRYGVRGYVTFNTLIFTDELREAERLLIKLEEARVDAIIVQDPGLARLAREVAPELELHASTQMTITSPEGLQLARELGITRAVLARELSLRELKRFATDGFPVEVFVHGALCVAYSGQCLTSESLGQRSANRGECAQACRLPYQLLVDGRLKDLGDKRFLLSPQDLAGIEEIPELIRLGVASFKIEGRLKSPEYVAAVTRVYRDAIDRAMSAIASESEACGIPDQDLYSLEMTFSRGLYPGWLHGVNHQRLVNGRCGKKRGAFVGFVQNIGKDFVEINPEVEIKPGDGVVFDAGDDTEHEQGGRIYQVRSRRLHFRNGQIDFQQVKVGDRLWKTDDPVLNRQLRQSFAREPERARTPVDMVVSGQSGSPLQLRVISGSHAVEVSSELELSPAKTSTLSSTVLREQLSRLGQTRYILRKLDVHLRGDVFMPIGFINRLRRGAIAKLDAAIDEHRSGKGKSPNTPLFVRIATREVPSVLERAPRGPSESALCRLLVDATARRHTSSELIVLCRSFDQIEIALEEGVQTIYVDFEDVRLYQQAVDIIGDRAHAFLATPRIQKSGEQGFFRLIENAQPYGVLIRNLGSISFFRYKGFRLHGDFSLNVANPLTATFFAQRGLDQLTICYDLNVEEVLSLLRYEPANRFELTIHQHMPMFHMEHCVFAAFLSNGTDCTSCGRPCDRHEVKLRDRVGSEHLVKADVGCRNTVYNSRAQSGAQCAQALLAAGLRRFRVEFLNENRSEAGHLIRVYRRLINGEIPGEEVWREIKVHFQLGVTKGTLE